MSLNQLLPFKFLPLNSIIKFFPEIILEWYLILARSPLVADPPRYSADVLAFTSQELCYNVLYIII